MNGVKSLLHSRKAFIAVMDAVISLILYFVVKYASPSAAEDVKYIIAVLQPVLALWIYSIATEDAARLRSGGTPGRS